MTDEERSKQSDIKVDWHHKCGEFANYQIGTFQYYHKILLKSTIVNYLLPYQSSINLFLLSWVILHFSSGIWSVYDDD